LSIIDLFVYILNTILYTNANVDSLRIGKPVTDSKMSNSDHSWILNEISKQKKNLVSIMKLPKDIFDTKIFNIKFKKADRKSSQKYIIIK